MAATETYPDDLKYHKEHDWARIDGDEAVLGITWFAQDALGELVHYEPPNTGDTVARASSFGEVETVKADPYGDGWLIRIRLGDPSEVENLLDVDAYKQVVAES